jgi:hypothetical protein
MKCKNCGHEIQKATYRKGYIHKVADTWSNCMVWVPITGWKKNKTICGCTNPEPKKEESK